jgi:hypothetical protein
MIKEILRRSPIFLTYFTKFNMENILVVPVLIIISFSILFYILNNLYLKNIELNKSLSKLLNIESNLSKEFELKLSDSKKFMMVN